MEYWNNSIFILILFFTYTKVSLEVNVFWTLLGYKKINKNNDINTESLEDILSWNFVETEKHNIISLWKVLDAISKKN